MTTHRNRDGSVPLWLAFALALMLVGFSTQVSAQTTYSQNFTGGQSTPSNSQVCSSWRTFFGQLSSNVVYDSIVLKGSRNETGFTCRGANANTLCQRIRTDNRSTFSITCDGRTWRTGGCGGGIEVNVNNGGICRCDSGSDEAVVRACIGNSNWGGYNGATCGGGTQRMDVICTPANRGGPPVVQPIADRTDDEGLSISLQVNATDPESNPLTYSANTLPTGLSINATTGLISGRIEGTASDNSPYNVTITVSDGINTDTENFRWTINNNIRITQHFYSENFTAGQSTPSTSEVCRDWRVFLGVLSSNVTYNVIKLKGSRNETGFTCRGANANTLCQRIRTDNRSTFSLTCDGRTWRTGGCGSGIEVNVNNSGICRCDNNANQAVVRACIGNSNWGGYNGPTCGGTTQRMDVFCEAESSDPPTVVAIADRTNDEGDTVSLQVSASDPENNPLTYSVNTLPGGLSLNTTTGLISGTIDGSASNGSPYSVTVTVNDGTNSVNRSFRWTINDTINITGIFYSENFTAGQSTPGTSEVCRDWHVFRGQLDSNTTYDSIVLKGSRNETGFTCTGTAANTLCHRIRTDNRSTFSISCGGRTWRTGGCGSGIEVNVNNSGICRCDNNGNQANVRACIGNSNWGGYNGPTCGGTTQRMDVACFVAGPNGPPTITALPDRTDDEEAVISLQISASDPDNNPITYGATSLPTGLSINVLNGLITGTIHPSAAANSPYQVTVTASDGRAQASRQFRWSINDTVQVPPDIYSENFTAGQSTPSSAEVCRDWRVFLGVLDANRVYSTVTLKGSRNEDGFTCVGPNANTICQRIRTDNRSRFSITCDGNTWQMGGCGSGLEVNVNNSGVCACDNGPQEAVVRPCIGNSNWGGYNGPTCGGTSQRMDVICGELGPNDPPSIQAIADRTDNEGAEISLQVNAADPQEGDVLTYSVNTLPDGLSLNSSTGLISGTIAGTASNNSPYNVVITVSDRRAETTEAFRWAINDTINITGIFYSENFTAGQSTPSTAEVCRDWHVFRGQLSSNRTYDTIVLKGSRNETGFSCTGTAANTLCQRIRTDNRSTFSISCGGRTWRTGGCGSGIEVNVNNSGICRCDNNANQAVVRACIGNSNWGGYNGPTCGGTSQRMDVACFESGPNDPPTVTALPDRTDDEGVVISLQVNASDPDNNPLTFSAQNLPLGLTINVTTGLISGTIDPNAAINSPYGVVVEASDGRESATRSFRWTINDNIRVPPVIYSENFTRGQSTPSSAEVCRDWRVFISAINANTVYTTITLKGSRNETGFSCTGPQANTLCQRIRTDNRSTFSLTCDGRTWRTGGCGSGMEVNVNNSGICRCDSGSDEAVVRPCIGNSNWGGFNGPTCGGDTQRMDVICGELGPNDPPTVQAIADRTDNEGAVISLQVSAVDPEGDTLTYSATNLPTGITINATTGLISGTVDGVANAGSPYSTTVTVNDGRDETTRAFTWTINDTINITQFQYSENFTAGQQTPSTAEVCRDWNVFRSQLQSNQVYDTIILKGSRNETGFTCTGTAANTLCQRIRSDNRSNFSVSCGGRTWRTGGCGNGVEVNVNNSGICRCDSGTDEAVVRPCIGNNNWGGFNGPTCGGTTQRMDVICRISGPNDPPTIQAIADQVNDERDVVSLQVSASDPDDNPITYAATNLPEGLSINTTTGLISGTVADTADAGSPYSTTITVSDGRDSSTRPFRWTINNNINIIRHFYSENFTGGQQTPSSAEVCRDWRVFLSVLSSNVTYQRITLKGSRNETGFSCNGVNANTLCQRIRSDNRTAFSLTCDGRTWRTGGCGSGLEVNVNNSGICRCDNGSDEAVVRPCIGNNNWGGFNGPTCGGTTQRMDVICEVEGSNDPPTIQAIADQTNDEGAVISLQVNATDPERDTLTFSASNLPTGLSINSSTGLISGTISGSADAGSPYSTTVTVSDGRNDPVTRAFRWTINDTINIVSIQYSENFTGGQQTPSNAEVCRDWRVFISQLDSNVTYTSITLKGSRNETGFTCNGTEANTLCQRIQSDNRTAFSLTCGGRTWRTGGCGSGMEVNVNNSGICRCDSGTDEAVVRPCIGNNNWGGFNGPTCGGTTQRMDVICRTESEGNRAPTVTSIPNRTDAEGATISLQVVASDADEDELTFTATGLPLGLVINGTSGLISGTINFSSSENSPYSTRVTVNDGTEDTVVNFQWITTDTSVQTVKVLVATPNLGGHGTPTATLLNDQNFLNVQATAVSSDSVTLAQMRQHHVVLVFTNSAPSNPGPLGDMLADYVDGGGNVVEAARSQNSLSFDIEGRWVSADYTIVNRTNNATNSAGTLGTKHRPTHPILAGVNALAVTNFRTGITTLKPTTQRLADYNDSQLLSATRENKNGRIAWVGFYPQTGYNGDALRMLVNSLFWAAGSGQDTNNTAPTVVTPGNQSTLEGDTASLQIVASDLNNDNLTFSATSLPTGLSINSSTGLISGTVANNARSGSPYTTRVTVNDGTTSTSVTFTWVVTFNPNPPEVSFDAPTEVWHRVAVTVSGTITDPGCTQNPVIQSNVTFSLGGSNGEFTFTASGVGNGRYTPLSVSVTSACTNLETVATRNFGVDSTAPLVIYTQLGQNGVDPQDPSTWPSVGEFDVVPVLMQLRDPESGLTQVTIRVVNTDNNGAVTLHTQSFPTSGTPASGPSVSAVNGCSNGDHCESGRLVTETLTGTNNRLEITVTNAAGGQTISNFFFRKFGLLEAIIAWKDKVEETLSTDNPGAQTQLDKAIAFFNVAINSTREGQLGSTALTLQVVEASLRGAALLDRDLDLTLSQDERDLVARTFIGVMSARSSDRRDNDGEVVRLNEADRFIGLARNVEDFGTLINLLANAFFFIEDAPVPMLAENFAETRTLLARVVEEMDTYITHDPELVGRVRIAEARTELSAVLELIVRVVDNGDRSLSDLEHLNLLLGLTNTAEDLKEAQTAGTWVRNWQWGLTQIVFIYAERGLRNATTFLNPNNPVLVQGRSQLALADGFRNDRSADNFMQLLIDSRCLVLSVYNRAYDPDEDVPQACCEPMIEFNRLDNGFPIPTRCNNNAPVITNIGDQSNNVNDEVSLQGQASDQDDDTLTWSATGLPTGLSINAQTGLISGTITSGDGSPFSVVVSVRDQFNTDTTSFRWTVSSSGTLYSQNFTSGQQTPGNSQVCTAWRTFLGQLDANTTYSSITLKGSRNQNGFTCTGGEANTLCQRIRTDNRTTFSITCNGRTWRTGGCGSGLEVNVNNSGICSCENGAEEAVVRPCIGNNNWGGYNGPTCGGTTQTLEVLCR